MDLSDHQWRTFRSNFVVLVLALSILVVIRQLVRRLTPPSLRINADIAVLAISSLGFLLVAHGSAIVFIAIIIIFNYVLIHHFGNKKIIIMGISVPIGPTLLWICNIVILLANEINDGYRFANVHKSLGFLDNYRGIYRWHVGFNMSTLRLISYGMDYYWSLEGRRLMDEEKHILSCEQCKKGQICYTTRQDRPVSHYSFVWYFIYLFYVPLILAGPITSYNCFASQITAPPTLPLRSTITYLLRFLFAFLLHEVMLSYFYAFSIIQSGDFAHYDCYDIGLLGYWTLNLIWLKFLVMWRFFRLIAMMDGVDTLENMARCVNNNYTLTGFWRNWHRSYNKWLVRYLYIPLGGSKRKIIATVATFTFVAFWHDLQLRLLIWGWLIALLFIPEGLASIWAKKRHVSRQLKAVGGAFTIFMMMVVNLIGFGAGIGGVARMMEMIFAWESALFLVMTFITFFVACTIMLEIRETEK